MLTIPSTRFEKRFTLPSTPFTLCFANSRRRSATSFGCRTCVFVGGQWLVFLFVVFHSFLRTLDSVSSPSAILYINGPTHGFNSRYIFSRLSCSKYVKFSPVLNYTSNGHTSNGPVPICARSNPTSTRASASASSMPRDCGQICLST